MKLSNKNTGLIGEMVVMSNGEIGVSCAEATYGYNSLSEFLSEGWEDYKPQEPLITDKKVRKAVRAWAEANDYGKDENYQFEDFLTGWTSWSLTHHNGDDNEIHFNGGIDFSKMSHQGYYTIAELCGEEE